jgi:hypothetical protein
MGFPGEDVLATGTDATNLLSNTRLHDLTIYVDAERGCFVFAGGGPGCGGKLRGEPADGGNSIFSPGGNGLTGRRERALGGRSAIARLRCGGAGNGRERAEGGGDGECGDRGDGGRSAGGVYAGEFDAYVRAVPGQWPQWSEFRNIDIRGVGTGIAVPVLPVTCRRD